MKAFPKWVLFQRFTGTTYKHDVLETTALYCKICGFEGAPCNFINEQSIEQSTLLRRTSKEKQMMNLKNHLITIHKIGNKHISTKETIGVPKMCMGASC